MKQKIEKLIQEWRSEAQCIFKSQNPYGKVDPVIDAKAEAILSCADELEAILHPLQKINDMKLLKQGDLIKFNHKNVLGVYPSFESLDKHDLGSKSWIDAPKVGIFLEKRNMFSFYAGVKFFANGKIFWTGEWNIYL